MIAVVIVRQGERPVVGQIAGTLESMQAIVGGYIEVVRRPELGGLDLVCNEEGMLDDLAPNGCGILGPYFFSKGNAEGDFVSLSEVDVKVVLAYYASHRGQSHPVEYGGDVVGFVSRDGGAY